MTNAEKAKAEQELFRSREEMDAIIIDGPDFNNIHDLNCRIGKVLGQLQLEGKIKRNENDLDFSKAVSKLRFEINCPKKKDGDISWYGKVMLWRNAAYYFSILADAFQIIESADEE